MGTYWDDFIAERALFDSAAFTTSVATMQTQANAYINS